MDRTGWWINFRFSNLATCGSFGWTTLERSSGWKRLCHLKGNFQSLFDISKSFSSTWIKGRAHLPKILCPKSRRVYLTNGLLSIFFLANLFWFQNVKVHVSLVTCLMPSFKKNYFSHTLFFNLYDIEIKSIFLIFIHCYLNENHLEIIVPWNDIDLSINTRDFPLPIKASKIKIERSKILSFLW